MKFSPRKFTTATSFPIKSAANGISEVITKSLGVSPFQDFVVSYIKASRYLKKVNLFYFRQWDRRIRDKIEFSFCSDAGAT